MVDPQGKVLLDQPDDGSGVRPEVLRGDLRRILLDSLPPAPCNGARKLTACARSATESTSSPSRTGRP